MYVLALIEFTTYKKRKDKINKHITLLLNRDGVLLPTTHKFQRQRLSEKGKESFIQKPHNFRRTAGFCLIAFPLKHPKGGEKKKKKKQNKTKTNNNNKKPTTFARLVQSCTWNYFSQ